MIATSRLRELAGQFTNDGGRYTYRDRLRVEREVFEESKRVAKRSLDIEFHGFSLASRDLVWHEAGRRHRAKDLQVFFGQAFEIRAFLSLLSSGEPYRAGELLDFVPAGRKQAVRLLGSMLRRFADSAENLEV